MAPDEHPGAGHRARLRERFLAHGLAKFTDAEVLELLLTLATPRQDCKQQARALAEAFGGLSAVCDAPPEELAKVKGIGPKNILGLKLIPAVARRYLEDRFTGQPYGDASGVREFLTLELRRIKREVFVALYLDVHRRVLAWEQLFAGTIDQTVVHPREVVARALARGAAAVVCAHNHPSGDPRPSRQDIALTRRLYHACRAVDLDLVDHLVVAEQGVAGLAALGELDKCRREYDALGLDAQADW